MQKKQRTLFVVPDGHDEVTIRIMSDSWAEYKSFTKHFFDTSARSPWYVCETGLYDFVTNLRDFAASYSNDELVIGRSDYVLLKEYIEAPAFDLSQIAEAEVIGDDDFTAYIHPTRLGKEGNYDYFLSRGSGYCELSQDVTMHRIVFDLRRDYRERGSLLSTLIISRETFATLESMCDESALAVSVIFGAPPRKERLQREKTLLSRLQDMFTYARKRLHV